MCSPDDGLPKPTPIPPPPGTVAALIERLTTLRAARPKPENGDKTALNQHLDVESGVEMELDRALAYYGPVLWRGQLWWAHLPPRAYRVNCSPFGGFAAKLYWPPQPAPAAEPPPALPAEPLPEKVAGFISRQHY